MKIITCTGFYGTGSSAVTDFFLEFSNCSSIGNYEMRFLHEPNGIRDLEYNIIENNQRHNTSHAIKQFIKYMKHLNGNSFRKGYKRYLGNDFENAVNKYVDSITELCCETWWNYDQISRGELFNDIDLVYQKICKKFNKNGMESLLKIMHEKGYFTAICKDEFYEKTKKFILEILETMNPDHLEYVMVDQLVPPTNIDQYLNYFDDIKVVVVDRDPRDCYLLEAEDWHTGVTPYKNVEEFCKWFEIIRRVNSQRDYDKEKVLRIRFEDLVYDYDNTTKKLVEFVGIDPIKHINIKKHFNPEISKKNTNLKKKYPERAEEISYIEQNLKKYLFPFDQYEK